MTTRMFYLLLALVVPALTAQPGCSTGAPQRSYKTVPDQPNRNTAAAKRQNERALALIENNQLSEAETALKAALTADITFGAAHNNLGKVYYHQKKLYQAAWEFQYAIKLMPNQPEPRNNLGLVFEAVGKLDDAVDAYHEALNLEPDNPQLIGNLVRARIRRGDQDDSVEALLTDLIMRESRPDWLHWARQRLAMMGSPSRGPDHQAPSSIAAPQPTTVE